MSESVSIYKLGIAGKAYDVPGTRRAYTYQHQPDNQGAWRLGEAMRIASKAGGGDYIDTGLGLLKQLELKGYGVYELDEAKAPEAQRPEQLMPRLPEQPEPRRYDYQQCAGMVPDGWRIERDNGRISAQSLTDGAGYSASPPAASTSIAEAVLYLLADALLAGSPPPEISDDLRGPTEMVHQKLERQKPAGYVAGQDLIRLMTPGCTGFSAMLWPSGSERMFPFYTEPVPAKATRIPAGLYAELEALRTLRDATSVYLQGYMRDEIEDEDNCLSVDQHDAACSVKSALDNARALEWKGGVDA